MGTGIYIQSPVIDFKDFSINLGGNLCLNDISRSGIMTSIISKMIQEDSYLGLDFGFFCSIGEQSSVGMLFQIISIKF